jgi:uncharacterized protein (TIGR02246 family)
MLEQVTWRHVGYAVLGAGVGGILGAGLLLAVLPALPAAEILELVQSVEIFEPAEPTIRALEQEWVDALNAGDVDRAVAIFDPEAKIQPSTGSAAVGRDAIRAFMTELVSRPGLAFETAVDEVQAAAANDLAVSQGSYRLRWQGTGGAPAEIAGRFTAVWGKREGQWRVLIDGFHRETPAGEPQGNE